MWFSRLMALTCWLHRMTSRLMLLLPQLIGRLTPEERLQRVLRYRNKRNMRNFNREIKYLCRKTLADSRPRVGGRFARNDDPQSVLPHQTKKALRVKIAAAPNTSNTDNKSGSKHGKANDVAAAATTANSRSSAEAQVMAFAAEATAKGLQQLLRRGANPASNTTTTTTGSSSTEPQVMAFASSDTKAVPGGVSPCAVPLGPITAGTAGFGIVTYSHANAFNAVSGLPCALYAAHGSLPGGVLLAPRVLSAVQLHHHCAVANVAVQEAVQGSYAHVAMAPATGTLPLLLPPALSTLEQRVSAAMASQTPPLLPLQVPVKAEDANMACGAVVGGNGTVRLKPPMLQPFRSLQAPAEPILEGGMAAEILWAAVRSGTGTSNMSVDG